MAGAAIAATVIGAGITAYGQVQQGKTANTIAQRNAQIQERNAGIAKQNAEFNAQLEERASRRRISSQVAGLSSSGIDVFDGTNLIAMAEQEFVDDMNVQLTRRGGVIESSNLMQQAGMTSAQGKAAQAQGYTAAGGSLLTGLGSAGMGYRKLDAAGTFD